MRGSVAGEVLRVAEIVRRVVQDARRSKARHEDETKAEEGGDEERAGALGRTGGGGLGLKGRSRHRVTSSGRPTGGVREQNFAGRQVSWLAAGIVPVKLDTVTQVVGVHILRCLATLSNAEKSEIILSIYVIP